MTYRSEGHDSHERERKTKGGIPIEIMGEYTERYEYEEDVEPGAKEEETVGCEPGRLALRLEQVTDACCERFFGAAVAITVDERCVLCRQY